MRRHHSILLSRGGEGVVVPPCGGSEAGSDYPELRIASIFIIMAGSGMGALLPVWLKHGTRLNVPDAIFFIAKYFGSGVILATAWMHLLSPASDNLRDECLVDILPDYDWAMAIGLMTVMVMFFIEILMAQFFSHSHGPSDTEAHHTTGRAPTSPPRPGSSHPAGVELASSARSATSASSACDSVEVKGAQAADGDVEATAGLQRQVSFGGNQHLGHQEDHVEGDAHTSYAAQMTAIFILEFGVIFHSIFIGLTLAVTDKFIILFVVLVFHQTFEGLGLGARLGETKWPNGWRAWTPYGLAGLYAVSTPIAIAIGLGIKKSLALDSVRGKIVNGVFDAISGGILMYTGLVELLAHEFMFNPDMRQAGLRTQLWAYTCVAVGAGLMAVLAKWA